MEETCPVCGVPQKGRGNYSVQQDGQCLSFCSMECLRLFREFPQIYLGQGIPEIQMVDAIDLAPA